MSDQRKRKNKKTLTTNNTVKIIKELRKRVKWLEEKLNEQTEKFEVLKEETENMKACHQDQLRDQIERWQKLEMEKELYEEREECRKFVYLFKDISTYKTIGNKLRGRQKLDQNERQTVMNHGRLLAAHGRSLQKREAIYGLHDAQNLDGHYFINSGAIDECLRLLRCRQYVYTYYDIGGGSMQQTIHAIESARVNVQFVDKYVQGQLKTITRNRRRKGRSLAKFCGGHHPRASGAPGVLRCKGRPHGGGQAHDR